MFSMKVTRYTNFYNLSFSKDFTFICFTFYIYIIFSNAPLRGLGGYFNLHTRTMARVRFYIHFTVQISHSAFNIA